MKRIKAHLLAFLMLFSLSTPVFAQETSSTGSLSSDVQNQMLRLLASIELESEYYGLSDADYSSICLGSEIPTYQVSNCSFIPADIKLVPITDGKQFLSLFCIATTADGASFVQLSNDLIDSLNNCIHGDPFAIIYDCTGVYAYANGKLHILGEEALSQRSVSISEIISIKDTSIDTSLNTNAISSVSSDSFSELTLRSCTAPTVTLNASLYAISNSSLTRETTYSYLNVDVIRQPRNTEICWAIALTSIINYVYDASWEYSEIVDIFNGGVDSGLNISEVIGLFNAHFDTYWGYSTTSTVAPSRILYFLVRGYPLFGGFLCGDTGHAVVIRGVNTSLRTASIMNPTPTTSGYTVATFSSNNTLSFVSLYNSETYTLHAYGFPTVT